MDYSKYMQGGQGGQGKDYQKYMDYSKYMQGGQGGQGGDYQKYMDYSKYMQGGQGGQGGDYQKYMDYSKYMQSSQGAGNNSDVMLSGQPDSQGGDYQKYMNYSKYMQGGHDEGAVGNSSLFAELNSSALVLTSAADCNTTAQLKQWRDAHEAQVQRFTPEGFRDYALEPIRQEYEKNRARILGEPYEPEALAAPVSAEACNTTAQLKQWRDAQEAQVKKFTPQAYR